MLMAGTVEKLTLLQLTKTPLNNVFYSINRQCQELIGLTWASNGLFFPQNAQGESTGEAYCQFDTFTNANSAMERNKECIGGRYIELFKSSNSEMRKAMIQDARSKKEKNSNGGSYQARQKAGGGTWAGLNLSAGASMHMHQNSQYQGNNNMGMQNNMGMMGNMMMNRGNMMGNNNPNMGNNANFGQNPNNTQNNNVKTETQNRPAPYHKPAVPAPHGATSTNNSPFPHVVGVQGIETGIVNSQIQDFFKPAKAIAINMLGNGYCDVAFKTHDDALQAMEKDRMPLQGSSINLTLKSQPPGQGWSQM